MDRIYRVASNGTALHVVERDGEWRRLDGDVFGAYRVGGPVSREAVRLLPPVLPSKIVAVGLNYRDHAAETGKALPAEPMIFLKPSTAVIGPRESIVLPPDVGRVDHEAEVGVVIKRRAHRVPLESVADYVLGLTCVNDVTARDLQRRDVQYTRCKGFDTFAPVGPCIAAGLTGDVGVEGWVNDSRRQSSNTRELIFSIDYLVSFISSVMTLLPGDIISTGTPAGIGPLAPGDVVRVVVDGVGELINPVHAAGGNGS